MSKLSRKNRSLAAVLIAIVSVFAVASPAAYAAVDAWGNGNGIGSNANVNIQATTGLGTAGPQEIAAKVINVILGFLGIVAVVIILLGGFKWMTAAGNEDKVEEAKKLISAGIIGLVIILAAFGIASFVIKSIMTSTGLNAS